MVPRVGAAPRFKPLARSHSSDTSTTKRPYRSPSPSSEADDEESLYDPPPVMASGDASSEQKQSRYPGEDTRLTSRKELAAWYSYGWAAEVFVVCGIGVYISHRVALSPLLSAL
jgi:UMF1 family MFS transporter